MVWLLVPIRGETVDWFGVGFEIADVAQETKQPVALVLLGLLNDMGPGRCHTDARNLELAHSCYEEACVLGSGPGQVFLVEITEEAPELLNVNGGMQLEKGSMKGQASDMSGSTDSKMSAGTAVVDPVIAKPMASTGYDDNEQMQLLLPSNMLEEFQDVQVGLVLAITAPNLVDSAVCAGIMVLCWSSMMIVRLSH
jgi:hypothetical protein